MRTRLPPSWMSRPSAVQPLVLVVEDEPLHGLSLVSTLASHGYRTLHAGSRTSALTQAAEHEPDLVLFDLPEPSVDSIGLATRLREWTSAPIVVLLDGEREKEKSAMLDAGANDFLVKPFATGDLLARMRVWLRQRAREHVSGTMSQAPSDRIRIDRERRCLYVEGREVHITPIECKLLLTLARSSGRGMSEGQVLAALWGPSSSSRVRYLRAQIRQLRQKIERDPSRPKHLLNEVGGGYRLKLS
jgi:two-component system, OmpR family, KDP operon response regulator KdpE